MADRRLREKSTAWSQRQAYSERRLRVLQLRANAGAVRTVQGDTEEATPTDLVDPYPVLSMTVPSGRWTVLGLVDVYVRTPITGAWVFLTAQFTDPMTAETAGSDVVTANIPRRQFYHLGTDVAQCSMTIAGDFVAEENVTISLALQEQRENAWTWSHSQLLLTPC